MPDYQGKGIMQEALEPVIAYGFKTIKLKSLSAYTHKDNLKSIALLERNGFIDETHNKPSGNDKIYRLVNK